MNDVKKILGAETLPEELMTSLEEAFTKRVAEAREEAEMAIREEFSRRYEHDKEQLIEAMDRMLSDVITKHEENKVSEIKKLTEAANALKVARRSAKKQITENANATKTFVLERVTKHVQALKTEKKRLAEHAVLLSAKLEDTKKKLAEQHNAHVKLIDKFVTNRVTAELKEFAQDKQALVETRAKLLTEGRAKLKAIQEKFIKESAKKVEKFTTESLNREMSEMQEDLERNRQNMFGRRIFEAFASEYLVSYLAEGSEIRKLQNVIESKETELSATKTKLTETVKNMETATRKTKLAEDKVSRSKIMSELLSNLRGEKRSLMENMLETTKTDALRDAFGRFLPIVLNEKKVVTTATNNKRILSEVKTERTVTGDRPNRLNESAMAEIDNEGDEIAQVVRLAGINR